MKRIYSRISAAVMVVLFVSGCLKAQLTMQTFSYTGTLQTFTVPITCVPTVTIEALGAGGGSVVTTCSATGGLGASMKGVFSVTPGQVLTILVGGVGQVNTSNEDAGGGGGSYVVATGNVPLVVAGGGGGATNNIQQCGSVTARNGANAVITTNGTASQNGLAAGGVNGAGGSFNSSGGGGAGGGFNTNGGFAQNTLGYGRSYLNGGAGGTNGGNGDNGGYGGGGCGWQPGGNGGGGGGYSGGGCSSAQPYSGGGGGGSYNAGTNQQNTAGVRSGHGAVIIQWNPGTPISLVATPSAICTGGSATLQAGGMVSYTWTSPSSNNSSVTVNPTSNTTFTVQGTNSQSCISTAVITVTVNTAPPVLAISNPSSNICLGRTVSLTATGALSYTWTGGVVNGQTFTPTSTNGYTVTGQNGCGIVTASTAITVAPLPVTAMATPTIICLGLPATLSATSAVTNYTWQPGNLPGVTTVVSPSANTVYTVTATDGTCSGTQTVSLQTKITPTITAVASSTRICQGDPVTLTASGAGTGGSYSWTPGGSGVTITMSPAASSLFAVTGTNSVNCTAIAQQAVIVDLAPAMNVVANKTLVCIQSSAILTASGANSYTWTNGPFVAAYTVTPTGALTIYTVIGSHQTNSCTATRTIAITAVIPNVAVTSTTGICEGASATLTASGATTYSWNGINNGSSGSFQPTPPVTTVYNLVAFTASANVNCPSYHTATVVVYASPTIVVTPGKQTICKGETHTLTATGAVTYSWSTTPGTGSVITVKPNSTTSYAVTGIDANGCENSTSYTAKVNACLGITETQGNQDISVYPNPSTGEFLVSTASDITLKVFNSIGQEVRTLNLHSGNDHQAQVKDLSSGVYFIVGENAEGKVNQKIIITK